MRNWSRPYFVYSLLVLLISFLGCSGTQEKADPMAIRPDSEAVDLSQGSVGIMIIRTVNLINPGYPPEVQQVKILSHSDGKFFSFKIDQRWRELSEAYVDNLISLPLPPGEYELVNFSGTAQKLGAGTWLMPANFSWNLHSQFQLFPGKVVYLGRILATNQLREGNEPTSGGSLPVIPQAASGFNKGTFSVKGIDAYKEDLSKLIGQFPWLQDYQIEKSLLVVED